MYYHLYQDRIGDWRWHYKSSNGRVIADSGEGYRNKSDCLRGIQIMQGSANHPIYE